MERSGIADIMAALKVVGVPEAGRRGGGVGKRAAGQASYPSSRPKIYADLLDTEI